MMESRGGKPKHLQLQGYSVAAWRPVCDGSSGIGKHSPMCPGGGGGGRWGGIPGDLETCAEQRTLLLDPTSASSVRFRKAPATSSGGVPSVALLLSLPVWGPTLCSITSAYSP